MQLQNKNPSATNNSASSDVQADNTVYSKVANAVTSSLSGALISQDTAEISDDGTTVRETGAIVEYLIEKYGKGRLTPQGAQAKLDNTFFLHFAEGSFLPPLVLRTVFRTIRDKSPFFVRPFTSIVTDKISSAFIDSAIRYNFGLVDMCLQRDGGRQFLAGGPEPTGGDFMMSTPISTAVLSGAFRPDEIPQSMKDYTTRIRARPAYQKVSALLNAQKETSEQLPTPPASPQRIV